MIENVIKKVFPIRDEKGRSCTFPTFASQVFGDGENNRALWQAGKGFYADDSAKLGGKAPEYYLQSPNLLDNSELLIAQAGFMGMNGSKTYLADRWIVDTPSNTSYDENTKTVTFTAASSPIVVGQKVSHNVAGKTLTLAIKASNVTGTILLSEANVEAGHRDVHIVEGITCYSVTGGEEMRVIFWSKDGGSMRIEWIALYEGSYTVETLPPYVPKGYANELLNCNTAETGRVHDSDKLGGKTPDYYLHHEVLTAIGKLVNSGSDTVAGYGYANVILLPNGIAEIHYNIQITTAGTGTNIFNWGLNRDLLKSADKSVDGQIPTIQPLSGGVCTYYRNNAIYDSANGIAGCHNRNGNFWQFARMYETSGSIGGWPTNQFGKNDRITGVCFGTYERT